MKELIQFKEWQIITESKQNIMGLGYPELIASLFNQKFGKNAFLLARWYREYKTRDPNKNWWTTSHSNFRELSLNDLIDLYHATDNPENYVQTLKKLDLAVDENEVYDENYLQKQKEYIKEEIERKFFSQTFFTYNTLVSDIISGKLKNIAPYKKMNFWEAQKRYDQKNIFEDKKPIKVYKNGFKWIDVGKRCQLVGHLMKNCGSAGVMSMDEDRTMIALFDTENKPHVVVTYSPNEKRISGDQGVASSEVKAKYHRYVLDLAQMLGAQFDVEKSKSKLLKMKYILQNKATNIQRIPTNSVFDEYFRFNMNGNTYYSNGYYVVSQQDMQKAQNAIQNGQINLRNQQPSILKTLFNGHNQFDLTQLGVQYTPLNQL